MGKAYANRKQEKDRPESDFYASPYPIMKYYILNHFPYDLPKEIYEPASGEGHISRVFKETGLTNVIEDDIRTTGKDFTRLSLEKRHEWIITNPPFSLFDDFVMSAKRNSDKFAFVLKTNFFGAHGRNIRGVWKGLKYLSIFDRQIDYRFHNDYYVRCGSLITGIGIWDMDWKEGYWMTNVIDVNDFCKGKL